MSEEVLIHTGSRGLKWIIRKNSSKSSNCLVHKTKFSNKTHKYIARMITPSGKFRYFYNTRELDVFRKGQEAKNKKQAAKKGKETAKEIDDLLEANKLEKSQVKKKIPPLTDLRALSTYLTFKEKKNPANKNKFVKRKNRAFNKYNLDVYSF